MERLLVHTRTVDYDASPGEGDTTRVEAKLCDIRRLLFRSLVRDGAIKPGLVHDVELDMDVGPDLVIRSSRFKMYTVPFGDPAENAGMSCGDIVPRFEALAGIKVDDRYVRSVVSKVGGVLGCFHGQTLAVGAGPVITQACVSDSGKARGKTGFGRHLLIDAFNYGDTGVTLNGRMVDSRLDLERNGGSGVEVLLEAELSVSLEVPDFEYHSATAVIRSSRDGLDVAGGLASELNGVRMGRGVFAEVSKRMGNSPEGATISQLLSMMIPVTTQGAMTQLVKLNRPLPGVGGSIAQVGSCHMWASGGPLEARLKKAVSDRFGKDAGDAKRTVEQN